MAAVFLRSTPFLVPACPPNSQRRPSSSATIVCPERPGGVLPMLRLQMQAHLRVERSNDHIAPTWPAPSPPKKYILLPMMATAALDGGWGVKLDGL